MAHQNQTDSRWQASPLNTVAFLLVSSPIPLVLPSSHVEVQQDTCWIVIRRKVIHFVPLVTMNPDSCQLCCKQSHLFSPPSVSTPHRTKILIKDFENLFLYRGEVAIQLKYDLFTNQMIQGLNVNLSQCMHTCLTLCDRMDYSPPGSSMGFSRQEHWSRLPFPTQGSSQPRD